MMRSMYSGVSGLRVHQSKMDTIGNNIANVNTVGFKRGQVTFQEVFSQVVRGASAPGGGKGGTNPQQVGMGVGIGSINTIHTVGPGQRTDNATDLMIDGEGFFVVSDDANYNNKFYTRAGNFTLDRDGTLVTADGFKVLGYSYDADGKVTSDVGSIRINKSETSAPERTTEINFKGNLNSGTGIIDVADATKEGHLIDTKIIDSLGNSYTITFEMRKTTNSQTDGNTWNLSVKKVTDMNTGNYVEYGPGEGGDILEGLGNSLVVGFDSGGGLTTIGGTPGDIANVKLNLEGITFDKTKEEGGTVLAGQDKPSGTFAKITLFDPSKPDTFKNLTQYANETDLKPHAQNGNTSGTLEGFSIDATGTVIGSFTNGDKKALGQVMLAKFDNPMGLQKMGSNFFLDTRNSGEAQFGAAGTSGYGAMSPGTLEMSNVDISLEFTEMITTQRGFQANSRIITTSDEMLQELVNLKR